MRVPLSFEFRVPDDEDEDDDGTGDWYATPPLSIPLFSFKLGCLTPPPSPCHTCTSRRASSNRCAMWCCVV